MIYISDLFSPEDKALNKNAVEYVNSVLQGILRSVIELSEDQKQVFPDEIPFVMTDICPRVSLREAPAQCMNRVFELYDLLCSPAIRFTIKPIYEYILFHSIEWFSDVSETTDTDDVFPVPDKLKNEIIETYGEEALAVITDLSSYQDFCFFDWDFLPEALSEIVFLALNNPPAFRLIMSYEELDEYVEIMDADQRDTYLQFRKQAQFLPSTPTQMLQRNILKALLAIQNNKLFYGRSENEINDGIRDILGMIYDVKDQTRRGESASGRSTGELDFLIYEKDTPIAIMEALKLDCMDKQYLSAHIEKVLYSYDPVGYPNAFILIYATMDDFSSFWEKCFAFMKDYDYAFPVAEPLCPMSLPYAETKNAVIVLERNGKPVMLNYYVIHIRS